ncbi:UCS-domain-containing protein Rng3 [Schizosaccharomyces cryophilus OY26]|uniref:UCS-domain-containing protein Rng3 n=1 Tax=Schizosaccharomyces cryophilus (strain OY26 / ATCC MYA-4695 / CBS 11777 / NBRC 106824 / NRRL Y48691) TaxID=653667 RepID=S9VUY2_SCHCR|nr:UCS-domain-containing protein Rng3 [Schizosaccharomyces cryophilus OY26]EPY51598.1 UCS-domain-containing protein Rng3 [Schizosaccharomyces cryophilus OY26]
MATQRQIRLLKQLQNIDSSRLTSTTAQCLIVKLILDSPLATTIALLNPEQTSYDEWRYLCSLTDCFSCALCSQKSIPSELHPIAQKVFGSTLLPKLTIWVQYYSSQFVSYCNSTTINLHDFPVVFFFQSPLGVQLFFRTWETIQYSSKELLFSKFLSVCSFSAAFELARLCQNYDNRSQLVQLLCHSSSLKRLFLLSEFYDLLSAIILQENPEDLVYDLTKECLLLARTHEFVRLSLKRMNSLFLLCLPRHPEIINKDFCVEWTELAERHSCLEEWLYLLNTICNFKSCRAVIHKDCADLLEEQVHSRTAKMVRIKLAIQYDPKSIVPRVRDFLECGVYDSLLLEVLRLTSTLGSVKKLVMDYSNVLKQLIDGLNINSSLTEVNSSAVILYNLCRFKVQKAENEQELQRLRTMAEADSSYTASPEDEQGPTENRIQVILRLQVLQKLYSLSHTHPSLNEFISKILVHIASVQKNRSELVQYGAIKFLTKPYFTERSNFNAGHALAKILISTAPQSVFTGSLPSNRAIDPISKVLLVSEETDNEYPILLAKFESLLALTNLASMDENSRQAITLKSWAAIDNLLISNHELIQRATVELVNNLSLSPYCLIKFIGENSSGSEATRLKILMALSDADDEATKLAACGTLVQISSCEAGCKAIMDIYSNFEFVIRMLKDENVGVQHRALVCICNFVFSDDEAIFAAFQKTPRALLAVKTYKSAQRELMMLKKEALARIESLAKT